MLSANQPLNIVSAEFKADPFPLFALPDKTVVWLLTRYDDVSALLRDERFTKNRRSALAM